MKERWHAMELHFTQCSYIKARALFLYLKVIKLSHFHKLIFLSSDVARSGGKKKKKVKKSKEELAKVIRIVRLTISEDQ